MYDLEDIEFIRAHVDVAGFDRILIVAQQVFEFVSVPEVAAVAAFFVGSDRDQDFVIAALHGIAPVLVVDLQIVARAVTRCPVGLADLAEFLDVFQHAFLFAVKLIVKDHHAAVVGVVGTGHTGFVTVIDKRDAGAGEQDRPGELNSEVGNPVVGCAVVAPFAFVLAVGDG